MRAKEFLSICSYGCMSKYVFESSSWQWFKIAYSIGLFPPATKYPGCSLNIPGQQGTPTEPESWFRANELYIYLGRALRCLRGNYHKALLKFVNYILYMNVIAFDLI